jgi:hypothetical protein
MLSLVASLGLLLPLSPQAAPNAGRALEPAAIPTTWELEFKFLDPRRIEVQVPGSSRADVYWYVAYTVTNPGPRSQRFFPIFQIVTEDLRVYDTDMGINPLVFEAIRQRHAITHKYLVEPSKAIGALLTGDDNARESVAIWRDIDLTLNSFTVYVAGLSGETRYVANPSHDPNRPETVRKAEADGATRETDVNPKSFALRKTLEIRYNLPGSPQARPGVLPERAGARWIMR